MFREEICLPLLNSVPVSCTKITPILLFSGVPASIGSSYAGLCNGPTLCSHQIVSDVSNTVSPLGFVTIVSDFGFLVIGFLMNFEISYQLFDCALAFFACSWLCSFACCLALLFCLLLDMDLFEITTSSMISAVVLVPVLFRLCFHQKRFVVVYDSVVRLWSSSFITTLLLVMAGFSFHGTVGN